MLFGDSVMRARHVLVGGWPLGCLVLLLPLLSAAFASPSFSMLVDLSMSLGHNAFVNNRQWGPLLAPLSMQSCAVDSGPTLQANIAT